MDFCFLEVFLDFFRRESSEDAELEDSESDELDEDEVARGEMGDKTSDEGDVGLCDEGEV